MHWARSTSWYDSLQASAANLFPRSGFHDVIHLVQTFMSERKRISLHFADDTTDQRRIQSPRTGIFPGSINMLVFAGNYTAPTLKGNKWLSWAVRDWQLGTVLRYASELPIMSPSPTTVFGTCCTGARARRAPEERS